MIKVVWGTDWDALLDKDVDGKLVKRMGEVVDGQYQKYTVSDGAYIRQHFFGADPDVLKMVEHLSDDVMQHIRRGGHDPEKVYAAYHAAVNHKGTCDCDPREDREGLRSWGCWRRQKRSTQCQEISRMEPLRELQKSFQYSSQRC